MRVYGKRINERELRYKGVNKKERKKEGRNEWKK
jgi:hypothetical protein